MVQPGQQTNTNHKGVDAAYESKEEEERIKLCRIKFPKQTYAYMATIADVEVDGEDSMDVDEGSWTELDSHADMPVVGRNAYIILDTGRVADVSPFTSDYASMQIRIVDAAVQ
jgi:hypothetical protein